MNLDIPLSSVEAQRFNVSLGRKACTLWIRQLETGLYLDLSANGIPVLSGCLCLDRTPLLLGRNQHLDGELRFTDTQGTQDPDYTGLGERWILTYFPEG